MEYFLLTHSPIATVLMNDVGEIRSIHQEFDTELIQSVSDSTVICDCIISQSVLRKHGVNVILDLHNKILGQWRKNRYDKLLANTGMVSSYSNYIGIIRGESINITRDLVKKNSAKSDEIVAQVIHAIDDMQKSVNLASNRLTEMYALHFPEMVDIVSNVITLARIILDEPQRDKLNRDLLTKNGIPGNKAELIMTYCLDSLGGDLSTAELLPLQEYARSLINMYEQMRKLDNWIDVSMSKIAPNLTAVSGANVGARLISAMGSLRNLAFKSSSKIQIIGAEKALYSALRSRGSPPKHGIIFQIPEIGNSPYWVRGKIARAFSSKIVIAARLDYFNGEFIGDKMRIELREFEKSVRSKYPNPPPAKQEKKIPRNQGKFNRKGRKGERNKSKYRGNKSKSNRSRFDKRRRD